MVLSLLVYRPARRLFTVIAVSTCNQAMWVSRVDVTASNPFKFNGRFKGNVAFIFKAEISTGILPSSCWIYDYLIIIIIIIIIIKF
jgi:hypothetical protein